MVVQERGESRVGEVGTGGRARQDSNLRHMAPETVASHQTGTESPFNGAPGESIPRASLAISCVVFGMLPGRSLSTSPMGLAKAAKLPPVTLGHVCPIFKVHDATRPMILGLRAANTQDTGAPDPHGRIEQP